MSESNTLTQAPHIPDLSNALRAIMPTYWRRISATLDGEPEAAVIQQHQTTVDRGLFASVSQAQRIGEFEKDPLADDIELSAQLAVTVDALSQRAVRNWQSALGFPPAVAIFVCRSFAGQLVKNIPISEQLHIGLLKLFGRLVIEQLSPALQRLKEFQNENSASHSIEDPDRVLQVALTMLQNEVVQALNSGRPAPACGSLDELLSSLTEHLQEITGRRLKVSQLAPEALARLSALFTPVLDNQQIDPSTRHLLATLMIPSFKLGLADPMTLSEPGRPVFDLITLIDRRARQVTEGSDGHRRLLQTIQGLLEDFRESDSGFVTTLVTMNARRERERRADRVSASTDQRGDDSELEQMRQQAKEAIATAVLGSGIELPALMHQLLEMDWTNWLTLITIRHGRNSAQWRTTLDFVDDLIWSCKPKQSIADVARLQSMLPQLATTLQEGLQQVGRDANNRREFFNELKTMYQQLIRPEFRSQLHIPEFRSPFKGRPVLVPVELDIRDPDAIAMHVRRLKPGSWYEFLTDSGKFVRGKLSWVSPVSDRFIFVDRNGLRITDKTQTQLRHELARGSVRALSRPAIDR